MDGADISRLERDEAWRTITALPQKFELFSREPYLRVGWSAAVEVFGESVLDFLQQLALLIIQPDCICARKAAECLDYLCENSFSPMGVRARVLHRAETREIWRYQQNSWALDVIELNDLIYSRSDSLLVFLRDVSPSRRVPASSRLANLKGSAVAENRRPGTLRATLEIINQIIVMVHCSDEPIDVLRELGILFGRRDLVSLFRWIKSAMLDMGACDPRPAIERVYACARAHDLNIEFALGRIRSALDALPDAVKRGEAWRGTSEDLAGVRVGGRLDWAGWSQRLDALGLDPAGWDSLVIATHFIEHDRPGEQKMIAESGYRQWLAGRGLLAGTEPASFREAVLDGLLLRSGR